MKIGKNSKSDKPNITYMPQNSNGYEVAAMPSSFAGQSQEEGGLEIGRIFEIVRRRAIVVLGVTTVVLGVSIIWSRTRPPAFEGSFRILIEPVTAESEVVSAVTGNQPTAANPDIGSPLNASKNVLDYPTQIQLLLSPKLLLPVLQKLEPSYPDLSYERLRGSLAISRLKEPTDTKILDIRYKSKSLEESKQVINLIAQTYISYSLRERQTNLRRAIQFLDAQRPKIETQVQSLEAALQNFRERNQIVDPSTLASQISSQIGSTQQQQLETQIELTKMRQMSRSLEQQLKLGSNEVEAASVLSEAPQYQALVKQLQDLDTELQVQSADLGPDHPVIISLQEKRAKLVPLLEQKATTVLGSGLSQSVTDKQSLPYQTGLRQDLSKQFIAAAIQVPVLESKLKGLNTALQYLQSQSRRMPAIARQYENMQRQLTLSKEQLSKFLQKREDLTINAAREEVPWELIAPPSVREVSSSSLLRDLSLGLILGLLLGTGVALLLEKMNDVIHSFRDLESEINIPILGLIPEQEDETGSLSVQSKNPFNVINKFKETDTSTLKESIAQKSPYRFSPFTESFRALNSQIRLLRPDMPIQSLVISSSLPDEGKTTVALHLARAATAMGQKVLLIDADFRKTILKEQISHHVENNSIRGLADVIVGSSELMDAVQTMNGYENLYILPAGSIVVDPTSLLSSRKMQHIMEECKHNFDLVIYDTVPLNFADSLLLIPQTDGLLMVTRLGIIHREILKQTLRTLEVSKVSVLGSVVNMH
ncbi:GumC family protein [Altericista sp. CCNU0014]|uniref:GumC family protein n=1 Tax=Altericista sp. CCNU0014 TaxID=3082949 RepID=UPI00384AE5B3